MDGLTGCGHVVPTWPELMAELAALEARLNEWRREWLVARREEGQLAMLSRLASHRFGAATAEALLAALAGGEAARLEAAELILHSETGTELLDRVNGKPIRFATPVLTCLTT